MTEEEKINVADCIISITFDMVKTVLDIRNKSELPFHDRLGKIEVCLEGFLSDAPARAKRLVGLIDGLPPPTLDDHPIIDERF